MPGKTLVQEGVLRADQLEHAAIPQQDILEEQLRLLAHRLPQIVVEIDEQPQVRRHRLEPAQVQPLRAEVRHQVARPRILQHARHLGPPPLRRPQFTALRRAQQRLIGQAAPKEKRKPRGEFQFRHLPHRPGRSPGRIGFHPEQKAGTHQNRRQRLLEARFRSA